MPRYKLTIEYDGMQYCGWQRQPDAYSVQEAVERAIYLFCQENVSLTAAGRTDAGVHAYGQVAHVDLNCERLPHVIVNGLNAWLRNEAIGIVHAEEVAADFHARFQAGRRHYQYHILNRRSPSPLDRTRLWHVVQPLDVEAMAEAARLLEGRHDFSSFRDSECQARSPLRTLDTLNIVPATESRWVLHFSAPSFLHHQVRIITGTLVDVGRGKYPPAHLNSVLEAKTRAAAGPTAPAHGLYFMKADYQGA